MRAPKLPRPFLAVPPSALAVLVTCLLAFVLAGCGNGGGTATRPTKTTNASTKPAKGCLGIDDRKQLAKNPPEIGLSFVSTDLDNFTGATPAECNRRALVYWGPDTPLANSDRPVVIVTLSFADDEGGARVLANSVEPNEVMWVRGVKVRILLREGQVVGRFSSGSAVVDVLVACVRPNDPQKPVSCRRPPQSPQFLRTRVRDTVRRLVPQLRAALPAMKGRATTRLSPDPIAEVPKR